MISGMEKQFATSAKEKRALVLSDEEKSSRFKEERAFVLPANEKSSRLRPEGGKSAFMSVRKKKQSV